VSGFPHVSLDLSPSLAGGVRLFGCVSLLVSLHLSPTLSNGVRLSGCLFLAFTCPSSFVSCNVPPNLSGSQVICLQLSVCLSGGVRLFRLFAFVCLPSLSLTICLLLDLSPKSLVFNHMCALVAVSCPSFIMMSFVFRVCLCSLNPIMFHHGFMRFTTCLPLVSHLSPTRLLTCFPLIISDTNFVAKK